MAKKKRIGILTGGGDVPGLNGVIKGWTEGVQLMVEGEKRHIWIPADLAAGQWPGAPRGMLIFEVELISVDTPEPAATQDKPEAAQ